MRIRIVFLGFVLAMVAAPRVTEAGLAAWLERLSGPGPYTGWMIAGDILCVGTPPSDDLLKRLRQAPTVQEVRDLAEKELARARRCFRDRSNTVVSVQLEYGRWNDKQGDAYVGDTTLQSFNAVAYVPVERIVRWKQPLWPPTRAIELGVGLGAYGLKGTTLRDRDYWRGVMPIRLRVVVSELLLGLRDQTPESDERFDQSTRSQRWRRAAQAVQFKYGYDVVLGVLDRDAFTAPGIPPGDKATEMVRTYGLQFDLGMIAKAISGH